MLGWFRKKSADKPEKPKQPAAATPPVESPAGGGEPARAPVAGEPQSGGSGLVSRLRERLAKTRDLFASRIDDLLFGRKQIDGELLDDLEEVLITADLGVATTHDLLEKARRLVDRKELSDPAALKKVLKDGMLGYLQASLEKADFSRPASGPFVIMVVGVNGVGKTTTIGKLAHKFVQSGQSVLLVAADTFRAAAIDQLQIWGERVGVEVVAGKAAADPSSVVYEGLEQAKKNGQEVVIVDTAGRLHTKANLMEELKKIKRVMTKLLPGAPHEVMLVLDATTGQNGISQVRLFNEAVELTGLTLTKLDGTAKGGIVVNICHEFNIPIRFIGIGEQLDDLRNFEPAEYVEALFGGRDDRKES